MINQLQRLQSPSIVSYHVTSKETNHLLFIYLPRKIHLPLVHISLVPLPATPNQNYQQAIHALTQHNPPVDGSSALCHNLSAGCAQMPIREFCCVLLSCCTVQSPLSFFFFPLVLLLLSFILYLLATNRCIASFLRLTTESYIEMLPWLQTLIILLIICTSALALV